MPGPERDIGLSQIVENASASGGCDVEVASFDAIKIDIERYERKALAGMARTLRDNRGIVQIEVLEAREETIALMSVAGYALAQEFGSNPTFYKT